jgi:16S rRNA (cytosine967-C5)-methyltransferase
MNYAHSYLQTAVSIIQKYNGTIPLHHYLKQYFSQHKQHGSKDRKHIKQLCYNYYRLGHSLNTSTVAQRLQAALFLCNEYNELWATTLPNHWLPVWNSNLQERIAFLHEEINFSLSSVFPFQKALSPFIEFEALAESFLIQPLLFIRIRPGKEISTLHLLKKENLRFEICGTNCIALPPSTLIHQYLHINKDVVIQDISSQKVASVMKLIQPPPATVWDGCAGSGGKSLLAFDLWNHIQLTVSDKRKSILSNLQKRFYEAGIQNYKMLQIDLSRPAKQLTSSFELIICDAPCSGSGTWSRTPEQLYFFKENLINTYARLQRNILKNALPHVKDKGYFLYITCSVFKQENEEAVNYIQSIGKFKIIIMEYMKGFKQRSDTLFVALLQKQS